MLKKKKNKLQSPVTEIIYILCFRNIFCYNLQATLSEEALLCRRYNLQPNVVPLRNPRCQSLADADLSPPGNCHQPPIKPNANCSQTPFACMLRIIQREWSFIGLSQTSPSMGIVQIVR